MNGPDANDTGCHGQAPGIRSSRPPGHLQRTHSRSPADPQSARRCWRNAVPRRFIVLTVAVLVAFLALLTLADVLPGQSDAPGLVAPLR
jgi:hypothetical protein